MEESHLFTSYTLERREAWSAGPGAFVCATLMCRFHVACSCESQRAQMPQGGPEAEGEPKERRARRTPGAEERKLQARFMGRADQAAPTHRSPGVRQPSAGGGAPGVASLGESRERAVERTGGTD